MSGFVRHPGILTDLGEIWEFIAADNLSAADRVLEEILKPSAPWYLSRKWATPARNSHRAHCVSIRFTVS
jgi:hypothetical protein